jgi:D-amino-acid dehydrogenase
MSATTGSGSGRSAVVIGGGLIGAASALYLARAGWRVTLVEQRTIGSGSSGGNCGLVCPSHVLPLAEPGMVAEGIKALFRRNAPLKVKPRFDPALWAWFWRFARRCNERDMLDSARGIQPLLESSLRLYHDMVEREGLECEWERQGLFFVYASPTKLEAYAPTDRLLREAFHCPARRLDGDEAVAFEPALREGLAGGWYYEDDAHLRPDRLLAAWRAWLLAAGAELREGCRFDGFATSAGITDRAAAVETDGGPIAADVFVVATGAWTPLLARHLGLRLPIEPGKGYSLTMPRPAVCPRVPLIFPETRVAVTPFRSGYRLGSTMEFAGYDETIPADRLELLKAGARPFLKEPYCEPVEEAWYGWRPMTYDGLPVIDRSPAYDNVLIAAGHNMIGVSMAPATGKLVAELLGGETPHVDPAPYGAARFGVYPREAGSVSL